MVLIPVFLQDSGILLGTVDAWRAGDAASRCRQRLLEKTYAIDKLWCDFELR